MGTRNISVGGDVVGSILTTGDNNRIRAKISVTLPDPSAVDIHREVADLKKLLLTLSAPDQRKLANALDDAESELTKPDPNKDEIGSALERAVGYATKAADFGEKTASIAEHLAAAVSWLGENWHKILPLAGLVL